MHELWNLSRSVKAGSIYKLPPETEVFGIPNCNTVNDVTRKARYIYVLRIKERYNHLEQDDAVIIPITSNAINSEQLPIIIYPTGHSSDKSHATVSYLAVNTRAVCELSIVAKSQLISTVHDILQRFIEIAITKSLFGYPHENNLMFGDQTIHNYCAMILDGLQTNRFIHSRSQYRNNNKGGRHNFDDIFLCGLHKNTRYHNDDICIGHGPTTFNSPEIECVNEGENDDAIFTDPERPELDLSAILDMMHHTSQPEVNVPIEQKVTKPKPEGDNKVRKRITIRATIASVESFVIDDSEKKLLQKYSVKRGRNVKHKYFREIYQFLVKYKINITDIYNLVKFYSPETKSNKTNFRLKLYHELDNVLKVYGGVEINLGELNIY